MFSIVILTAFVLRIYYFDYTVNARPNVLHGGRFVFFQIRYYGKVRLIRASLRSPRETAGEARGRMGHGSRQRTSRTRRSGRATNKSPEDVPSPPVRLDATTDSLDGLLRPRARRRHHTRHARSRTLATIRFYPSKLPRRRGSNTRPADPIAAPPAARRAHAAVRSSCASTTP